LTQEEDGKPKGTGETPKVCVCTCRVQGSWHHLHWDIVSCTITKENWSDARW